MAYYVYILANSTNVAVYIGVTNDVQSALEREKQLKGWRRSKKNALVTSMNPEWKDLYPDLLG